MDKQACLFLYFHITIAADAQAQLLYHQCDNGIPAYTAIGITILELIEETILVMLLPKWEVNVKGIYWALKKKQSAGPSTHKPVAHWYH